MRRRRFPDLVDTAPANDVGLDLLAWVEEMDEDGYGSAGEGGRVSRHAAPDAEATRKTPSMVDARRSTGTVPPTISGSLDKGWEEPSVGDHDPAANPEGEAWALLGALLPCLFPVLRACRSGPVVLDAVSLSLTVPLGGDLRGALADLARWIESQPGGGALLIVDRGVLGGEEHLHGLALVPDQLELTDHWLALPGARGALTRAQRVTRVTGWPEHMRGEADNRLLGNMAHVLGYGVTPFPAHMGRRDLDRDVVACGVLAAPWRATLAAARGEGAPEPGDARKASPRAGKVSRACSRCREPIPAWKRSDALHCSDRCRKAAYRVRRA